MDVGVEIMFVAVLCAEIVLLPVWAVSSTMSMLENIHEPQ